MKCPYCNQEMEKGYIRGDRFSFKWRKDGARFLRDKPLKLTDVLVYNNLDTYLCKKCRILIHPIEDLD